MSRLPAVLTTDDLPLAELTALAHDGVLRPLGSGFVSIDEPETRAVRARSAAPGSSGRMIAERLTAAWIWGALDDPPARVQFCTDLGARATHRLQPGLEVREVVLSPSDTVEFAGIRVTTPVRTVCDLARFAETWSDREASAVRRLRLLAGVGDEALTRELSRVNLPHKRRAQERLALSPS